MKKSYILYSGVDGTDRENIAVFNNKRSIISTGIKIMKFACRKILEQHPDYYIKIEYDKVNHRYDFNLYNKNGAYLSEEYQCFLSFESVVQNPTKDKDIKKLANKYFVVLNKTWY